MNRLDKKVAIDLLPHTHACTDTHVTPTNATPTNAKIKHNNVIDRKSALF